MKKCFIFLLLFAAFLNSEAQDKYRKLPSLGIFITGSDYITASDLRSKGLKTVLNENNYFKSDRRFLGLAASYLEGLTDHIDIQASLGLSYPAYQVPGVYFDNRPYGLLEFYATGNFKLLTDRYFFVPYLSAGVGASKYGVYYSAFLPLGAGFQFRLAPDVFLMTGTQYRVAVTEKSQYHLLHYAGIVAPITTRKASLPPPPPVAVVPPPPPPPPVTDRDGDGIPDTQDACPDLKGLPAYKGCPDTDADGIADKEDKCPEKAGLARYEGCPVPDTDGDGIDDENDKCVSQKGYARYQGCPIPDTDGDMVNNEDDKCPDEPGPADNDGCPKLESYNFNYENVQFVSSSAELTSKAKTELDKLAAILNEHDKLGVNIDGYTDNTGKPENNLKLSKDRAEAVKKYLTSKGISSDRLSANGYGQEKPVADNKTAEGRSKNRRVEFSTRQ